MADDPDHKPHENLTPCPMFANDILNQNTVPALLNSV